MLHHLRFCYNLLRLVTTCYDLLHVWQGIQVDVEAEVRTLDRLQLDKYDHIVALRLMGNRNEPLRRFPGMFNVCLNIKTTIGDNCQLQTDSRILRMMWVESQYSTPQHGCLDRRTTDFFYPFLVHWFCKETRKAAAPPAPAPPPPPVPMSYLLSEAIGRRDRNRSKSIETDRIR